MSVSYIGTDNSLTVVFSDLGKVYNVDDSSPNWDKILEKLENSDYEGLEELLSAKKTVETFFAATSAEGVEVDEIGVKFNGAYVHNYLTGKILDFAKRGLPVKALVKFFEKVMKNPSHRAVNELYKFLEHGQMPITPDGNFLGYKSVNKEYKDWYTGKFDNSVGQTLEMPRNSVCDDPDLGCSYGFHVGTLDYARNFNANNRIVIVEVDPADVVSVPHDCNHQKLRTAKYTVVGEFEKPLDNDFSDEYNKEDDAEDIRLKIVELKNILAKGSHMMTADDIKNIAKEIATLEEAIDGLDLEDERTYDDVQEEINDIRDSLVRNSHLLSPSELADMADLLGVLEEELEELAELEDEDEECDEDCTGPCRDEKGRFCKRNN